jgi:hypothetical protein
MDSAAPHCRRVCRRHIRALLAHLHSHCGRVRGGLRIGYSALSSAVGASRAISSFLCWQRRWRGTVRRCRIRRRTGSPVSGGSHYRRRPCSFGDLYVLYPSALGVVFGRDCCFRRVIPHVQASSPINPKHLTMRWSERLAGSTPNFP